MSKKVYLYPLWLRIWHWANAFLYLILILTGISLHYSDTGSLLIPFSVSVLIHNISGVLLTLLYLIYAILNITSGNYKFYLPKLKTLLSDIKRQIKFYMFGIFDKERHPFPVNEKNKFNPMQKLSYLAIMFIFTPMIIISGWLLMFPELAPDEVFGMGGVWPMALLHIITGYILSIFMFVHIYLGTTGHTAFDLFKAMITGWNHIEEERESIAKPAPIIAPEEEIKQPKKKRLFPQVFYNPITLAGALITLISFGLFLFFLIMETITDTHNPYVGIITFLLLPSILIFGLILIAFGIFRENRILIALRHLERRLPVIDLNNPKHQVAVLVFTIGTIVLIMLSVFGSFKAYEYTESDEFCGTLCHIVMEPEWVTYKRSPHSHVGCVKCHIGPGADWFVKSKLSGVYQIYSTLANKYSRPIETPVRDLRPAQETCEQCHWPKHFYHPKTINRNYYVADEKNSKYTIEMLMHVGGGNIEIGNVEGIHWHMNLGNEIHYYATDHSRQEIPWVKSKSLTTGREIIYKLPDFEIDPDILRTNQLRKFDCIDCHNRPSHKFNPPAQIVNLYLSMGRIDPSIPYIKKIAVQALESNLTTTENVYSSINKFVWTFYENQYPNLHEHYSQLIQNAVTEIANILSNNYFPKMRASWRSFPDNIGHLHSPGCFRCHDGNHVSPEGKVLTNDCNACHTFKSEILPSEPHQPIKIVNDFVHPGYDDEAIKRQNCVFCHGTNSSVQLTARPKLKNQNLKK